jgi:hypothetical protein
MALSEVRVLAESIDVRLLTGREERSATARPASGRSRRRTRKYERSGIFGGIHDGIEVRKTRAAVL